MTQVFDENNRLIPVTVIEVGPCSVTQIKTEEKDGYQAVQIGFGPQKESRLSQPVLGHLKKAGVDPVRCLKEFRTDDSSKTYEVGEKLTIDAFSEIEKVDVIATAKGRGFQGVVKRWGFSGGPASHGSMFHRRGGSYGMCQWPGEILKGKKMPGRMGGGNRTTQNLKVVKVIPEKNLLLVKGSFPGYNGSIVSVRPAIKKRRGAA